MDKTRGLRKYRRKTKRVKSHVKPFSKKSKKRASKHKKNKRSVKRRLGVKNRKSRRIARGGEGEEDAEDERTTTSTNPDIESIPAGIESIPEDASPSKGVFRSDGRFSIYRPRSSIKKAFTDATRATARIFTSEERIKSLSLIHI